MIPIYRWNGEYFGFIKSERLFDASSDYLGWVTEDRRVWQKDGTFLGEIVNENYILRRTCMATPAVGAAKAHPARPTAPARRANKAARAGKAGHVDALDEF